MALTILAEQQDGLLLLTLNRPDKRNALNTEMYLALTLAFQQAALDESVHVVLLQGQQECFTAGNDLADFMGKSSKPEEALARLRLLNGLYPDGEPKPGEWIKLVR